VPFSPEIEGAARAVSLARSRGAGPSDFGLTCPSSLSATSSSSVGDRVGSVRPLLLPFVATVACECGAACTGWRATLRARLGA